MMTYRNASIAANTKVSGIFAGKYEEYVQVPRGILTLMASAAAVGLTITVNVGGRILIADEEVPGVHAAGGPIKPDDILIQAPVLRGDRVLVDVRNPTAGALTNFVCVAETMMA